ncbi:response regulator transcription factor [Corynebacterium sp. CCUG 70398]|mgnify:FL=1|uniref:response regulator n=1 Tax=Corynebacterium sp. CCUG 70398 TaxID=2823891 RepID=UPI00210B1857|nr:response regulator transcription factor [Corynebacterium sp. CCUG 70398]MCQ4622994.1 response regulator transcription factor [Corynebacterium sp. CCUG 70398]
MSASIVLIDDNTALRDAYRRAIELHGGLAIVGEASGGAEGARLIQSERPTVALVDMRMPELDGLGVLRAVDTQATKVIIFTAFNEERYVEPALRLGASGFLLKNSSPRDVLAGIDAVLGGNACLAPEVARRLLDTMQSRSETDAGQLSLAQVALSEREREVIALVARGMSNRDIAAELVVEPETVRTYLKRIFAKTGMTNRTMLAVAAIEAGLAAPGR